MLKFIELGNKFAYVKIIVSLLFLSSIYSAFAYDTRIISLGNPTLSLNAAAIAAGYDTETTPTDTFLRFPGDEYGLGLSSIPDTLDIWKLPARLADRDLFPKNAAIIDFGPGRLGNGGIVIAPQDFPVCFGLFFFRPTLNGWVIGEARDVVAAGTLNTFFEDATGTTLTTAPTVPYNLADLFLGLRLGSLLVGAGAGVSYSNAIDATSTTAGVNTTQTANSLIVTLRGGATLKLEKPFPFNIDLGLIVPIGKSSASNVVSDNTQNDTLTATNIPIDASLRLAASFIPDLEVFLLGMFDLLPQQFEATNNGTVIDTTTAQIDKSSIISFGAGTGVNWKTTENLLVNVTGTFVFSNFNFTEELANVTPRPEDYRSWTTGRVVVDMEYGIIPDKFIVRGGINGYMAWPTNTDNITGTDVKSTSFKAGAGAAAGLTFQPVEAIGMDFALNLTNFTDAIGFRTISTQMTTTISF